MSENNLLLSVVKKLNSFHDSLKSKLDKLIFQSIECYLMHKDWKNNLLNYFTNDNYKEISNKSFCLSFFPEINQSFIDNFTDAINLLQNNQYFTYTKKNVIELLIDKNELFKYHNVTKIYAANKKIIINFQGNDIDKSILIINPFDNFDKKNIFIILCNNYKIRKNLFESLLSENNNYFNFKSTRKKNENYIIKLEDYLKVKNNESEIMNFSSNIINNNEKRDIDELLRILILIYYYEQYLSEKNNCLSEYQTYYLINPEWIKKYKEFYHYNDLFNLIKNNELKKNNDYITYLNINNYINIPLIKYKKNYMDFNIKIGIPEDLKNSDSLTVSLDKVNNLRYYNKCYILPLNILNKIIEFEFNNKYLNLTQSYKILSRNRDIYIHVDKKNINLGKFNEKFVFKTKYIISYSSSTKYEKEKRLLFNLGIKNYLYQNNCYDIISEVQTLRNKKDNNIGKVLILNENYFYFPELNKSFSVKKLPSFSEKKLQYKNQHPNNYNITNYSSYKNLYKTFKKNSRYNSPYINIEEKTNSIYTITNEFDEEEFNSHKNEIKNKQNEEKISNLEKELKENKEKYEQKEKDLENNILILKKEIEKSNIKNKELNDKIDKLEKNNKKEELNLKISLLESKKIIEEKTNKEKEYISLIDEFNKKISSLENNDIKNNKIIEEKINKEKEHISLIDEFNKNISKLEKNYIENKKIIEEKTNKEKEYVSLIDEFNKKIPLLENNDIENKKIIEKKTNKENEYISLINELKQKNNEKEDEIQKIKEKNLSLEKYEEEYKIIKKENEKMKILIKSKENNIIEKEKEINLRLIEIQKREEGLIKEANRLALKRKNIENENNKLYLLKEEYNQYLKDNENLKKQNNDLLIVNLNLKSEIDNRRSILKESNLQLNNDQNNIKIEMSDNSSHNTIINNIENNNNRRIYNSNPNNNLYVNDINNISNNQSQNDYINNNNLINENNPSTFPNIHSQNNFINNFNNINYDNNNFNNNINNLNYNNNNNQMINNMPVLVGLNNIGALCYMNSTLQCLSQTYSLTLFLLDSNNEQLINNIKNNNKINLKLTPVYVELIRQLWFNQDGHTSFAPYLFKNTIEQMNPYFKENKTNRAKDLILFILEQLHKELRSSNNNNQNLQFNQYDRKNSFSFFLNNFKNSIISEIFYGIKERETVCLNCKNKYNSNNINCPISYNYDFFNCLIFPLEEVKNMKNNKINNGINNYIGNNINDVVTLNDCFDYYQRKEKFTGENKNYCNLCQQFYDAFFYTKIFYSPNVLIIILNRGKDNIYDVKLEFQENINIDEYDFDKNMHNNAIYDLYGVISNIVEFGSSSHFIANCKSPIDNNWYRFDDSNVSQINNIQQDVIEFGTPHILFYKKQKYRKDFFSKYKFN